MKKTAASMFLLAAVVMAAWLLGGCGGAGDDKTSQLEGENDTISTETQEYTVDGPAPKIEFEETTHDFGTVPQQSSLTHKFKVKNVGDAPLQLIRAKAG